MAVLPSYLPLLDACHRQGGLQSPLVALGSQQYLGAAGETFAGVLRDRYGLAEYLDVDVNGESALDLDLTAPLPEELVSSAGTVLDAGTLEHIFDLAKAVENVHRLLRPGGTFVAFAPLAWYEHGFVNFNPKLFRAVAVANGWSPLVEGYWFRLRLPFDRKRFVTVLTREGDLRPRRQLWVDRVLNRVQPAGTVLACCYRKAGDQPFAAPVDVFPNW